MRLTHVHVVTTPETVAGVTVMDEISPFSKASTPVASGLTMYLPRPMNSEITFWVIRFSTSKIGVLFANIGIPIVLMDGGRNEPRPASE